MLEVHLQQMKSTSRAMQELSGRMRRLCGRIEQVEQGLSRESWGGVVRRSLDSQQQWLSILTETMNRSAQVLEESARLYELADLKIAEQPLPTDGGWNVRRVDLTAIRALAAQLGRIRF